MIEPHGINTVGGCAREEKRNGIVAGEEHKQYRYPVGAIDKFYLTSETAGRCAR